MKSANLLNELLTDPGLPGRIEPGDILEILGNLESLRVRLISVDDSAG
jgi:hypothetical protein